MIISGPSGAGKGTLVRETMKRDATLTVCVSHTTRRPRPSEQDGENYFFVDDSAFTRMIEQGEFVEWAEVHGHRYGTSAAELKRRLDSGRDVILEIDYQGALQVREKMPSVLVCVIPPSPDEMIDRIRKRNENTPADMKLRLRNAGGEIRKAREHFDYLVVNDDLGDAVERLLAIAGAERLRMKRNYDLVGGMEDEFTRAADSFASD